MPRMDASELAKKHWFIIGILISFITATLVPQMGSVDGPLQPNVTAKYLANWVIFFISGMTLKTEDLKNCVFQYKLNGFIQLTALIIMPMFVKFVAVLLEPSGISEWVLKGFVALSCVPSPVSSTVILTHANGGNEPSAIVNSVLTNIIGIVATPFTLLFFLGSTTTLPLFPTFESVALRVGLPLAAGQLTRTFTGYEVDRRRCDATRQVALLYIIYIATCQTFLNQDLGWSASTLLYTVLMVVLMQMLTMLLVFCVATRVSDFTNEDVIAIVFCSTQKSLTLGMPILRTLYAGYAHLASVSLPMLLYHPTQMILGALVAEPIKDWKATASRNNRPEVE